jgi:hypothetical protein
MEQKRKEQLLQEVLDQPDMIGIYNTALDSKQGATFLLNLLRRRTEIAKCDIVEFLNQKGFNYATDRKSGSDKQQ